MSVTTTVTISVITCSAQGCGVTFGLDEDYIDARRKDHASWYCPNGHSRYYPDESNEERLARELKDHKRWLADQESYSERLNGQLTDTQNRLRSTKGVVTKMRKRAHAGVCQFCRRHFADVEAHCAAKHPGETR